MEKPIFKNRPNTEHKVEGGKTVWSSRSVALDAIVFAIDKSHRRYVLIERRSDTMMDHPGEWCCPCGYLDWDENGWEAVTRELYEETGFYVEHYKDDLIMANRKQPFYVQTEPTSNRQNIALAYCFVFRFDDIPRESWKKKVESYKNPEIAELKWVPVETVPEYHLIFDHDERIRMAMEKFGL